jgi:hypothetical protein
MALREPESQSFEEVEIGSEVEMESGTFLAARSVECAKWHAKDQLDGSPASDYYVSH